MHIVYIHQFLHMGFFFSEGKIENAKLVFVSLSVDNFTSLSRTSLLSIMRASVVLQRVELIMVAKYPAKAVQIKMSLMAVDLLFLRTVKAVGPNTPKKAA